MPFVGAIITPHTPLLLPTVGKEYRSQTKKTIKALDAIGRELHAMNPEVILIIHPHNNPVVGSFALSRSEKYLISLKEFGDLVTTAEINGDTVVTQELKEGSLNAGFPVTLTNRSEISYDAGVPLLLLGQQALSTPVATLCTSSLARQVHATCGAWLADSLHTTHKRVAVIVSAELSQHTTSAAPSGIRDEGKIFDEIVMKLLGKKNFVEQLLRIDQKVVMQAEACGYLPLIILGGLINTMNCHVRKISYETPFGIGFLSAVIQPA